MHQAIALFAPGSAKSLLSNMPPPFICMGSVLRGALNAAPSDAFNENESGGSPFRVFAAAQVSIRWLHQR